jgi:hypothetical protein
MMVPLVTTVLVIVLSEVLLRLLGFQPFEPVEPFVHSESGRPFFAQDPLTGFTLAKGQFTVLSHKQKLFVADHGTQQRRALPSPPNPQREVWFLGGSYTYGWGVDDDAVFAAQIADRLEDTRVVNYAVPAFGSLQCYLRLRDELTSSTPDLVVLGHAPFHLMRNVRSRAWQKVLSPYNHLGKILLPTTTTSRNNDLAISFDPLHYEPLPLSKTLTLVHLLDKPIADLELSLRRDFNVSLQILKEMNRLVDDNGGKLVIANLTSDRRTSAFANALADMDVHFVDITVDMRLPEHTLEPRDSHPSELAHKKYAAQLLPVLTDLLQEP